MHLQVRPAQNADVPELALAEMQTMLHATKLAVHSAVRHTIRQAYQSFRNDLAADLQNQPHLQLPPALVQMSFGPV